MLCCIKTDENSTAEPISIFMMLFPINQEKKLFATFPLIIIYSSSRTSVLNQLQNCFHSFDFLSLYQENFAKKCKIRENLHAILPALKVSMKLSQMTFCEFWFYFPGKNIRERVLKLRHFISLFQLFYKNLSKYKYKLDFLRISNFFSNLILSKNVHKSRKTHVFYLPISYTKPVWKETVQ